MHLLFATCVLWLVNNMHNLCSIKHDSWTIYHGLYRIIRNIGFVLNLVIDSKWRIAVWTDIIHFSWYNKASHITFHMIILPNFIFSRFQHLTLQNNLIWDVFVGWLISKPKVRSQPENLILLQSVELHVTI